MRANGHKQNRVARGLTRTSKRRARLGWAEAMTEKIGDQFEGAPLLAASKNWNRRIEHVDRRLIDRPKSSDSHHVWNAASSGGRGCDARGKVCSDHTLTPKGGCIPTLGGPHIRPPVTASGSSTAMRRRLPCSRGGSSSGWPSSTSMSMSSIPGSNPSGRLRRARSRMRQLLEGMAPISGSNSCVAGFRTKPMRCLKCA